MRHVLDAEPGKPVAQPVAVQPQLPRLERGPGVRLLLGAGPRRRQRARDVEPRHDHHTVVVAEHDVAGVHGLSTHDDRHVDRARGGLHRALRADRPRPDRKAHLTKSGHVAYAGRQHRCAHPALPQGHGEQLTEHPVGRRRRGGHHQQVTRPALLDRDVDHEVVARPAEHGDRGAAGLRAGPGRSELGAEIAGAADGLVDGGDAEAAQSRGVVVESLPSFDKGRSKDKAAADPKNIATKIVAIGISTGGPQALQYLLPQLPADFPGTILVVQHMPDNFTEMFARRLDEVCAIRVKEAQSGDLLQAGRALICPGNRHMKIKKMQLGDVVVLNEDAKVNGHRPSVDVLFRSVAEEAGNKAVGVIMTGMGDDGAEGLGAIKAAGGTTIAQSEESCVVYGMPKAAIERGYAIRIISLDAIANTLLAQCKGNSTGGHLASGAARG